MPVHRLLYAVLGRTMLAEAGPPAPSRARWRRAASCAPAALRLDVIWPPPELLAGPHAGEDPNLLALVIVARWRDFSMLLTADAEAESTPIDPGPVDVLKVAHHGSDDAGLGALLDRTRPRLAVISVGAGNPYGHPTAATLATLAAHGVPRPAHRPRRHDRPRGRPRTGLGRARLTPAPRLDSARWPRNALALPDRRQRRRQDRRDPGPAAGAGRVEGGGGALEVFEAGEGRGAPDHEALLGRCRRCR